MIMNINDYERIPSTQTLRGPDLLKTLPPQTKLFDIGSSSESQTSELSGPFSEVVYSVEVESKRKAKELFGKDLYTAFSFSPEFKAAIEGIKKELIFKNPDYLKIESMVTENFEEIKSRKQRHVFETEKKVVPKIEFLQFPHIDYEVEEKEEEEIEEKKKDKEPKDKKKKTVKVWQDEDEEFFDTMSGYWRLLSEFDEFKISPPWYDAYAEGKQHWLQTKPIPTEVFENSREKCLNWLTNYFDK